MSNMGRWEQSSKGDTQLSARIDPDLKESFRGWCDDHDTTMTDEITEHIEEITDENHDAPSWLPDDEDLADAWRVLDRHVRNERRRIDVQLAITLLADQLNIPKQAVKSALLIPLEHHDPQLVRPVNGVLFVRPRPGEREAPDPDDQDAEEIDREEIRETMEALVEAEPVESPANHHEPNG